MSVSVSLVRSLVEEIVRAGADPDAFLAAGGVMRAQLDDSDARISLPCYDRLQELAIDTTGDPALGLHMAARAPLSTFDVVGLLSIHCRTIREALGVFAHYRRLLSDCDPPAVTEEGNHAIITVPFIRGNERCNRMRAEFGITCLVKIAEIFFGSSQKPLAVEFEHAAPSYASEYAAVLGCAVRFGCSSTRIVMDRRTLDAPQRHANAELFRVLESPAASKLAKLSTPPRIAERVRALIVERYEGCKPTMPTVARSLGVSARSLRRRLHDEGRTYAEVVDEAMADVACRLLANPASTIHAVAERLGFSEPSAFHRAFKRWTGRTPRQFRERRGASTAASTTTAASGASAGAAGAARAITSFHVIASAPSH